MYITSLLVCNGKGRDIIKRKRKKVQLLKRDVNVLKDVACCSQRKLICQRYRVYPKFWRA